MRIAKPLCAMTLTCGVVIAAGLIVMLASDPPALAASCANPRALGTSRTLVVDPAEHVRLGAIQYRETLPLADHEVVLTFDDGPLPPYSTRILDVLASECVKATFFIVGSMARANPEVVARIAAEGHTVGTHSQNHPLTFHRMGVARAEREIQGGIASVSAALGRSPAPFFRIPGFLRSSSVEHYLASQNLMTWSADVASDDWRRINDKEIVRRTIQRLEERGRGMILMHDIKPATALALPVLLRELKARGYRVVHVVPATRTRPKTVTADAQWSSRNVSYPPRIDTQIAGNGIAPSLHMRNAARADLIRRREAARRRASAQTAVIDEGNPPEAVAAFQEKPLLWSNLLKLPWRILQ